MGTALIGLLGVVVGAAISSVLTYALQKASDERMFKREDKYRDYAEQRQVYAEFLSSWRDLELRREKVGDKEEWYRGEAIQKLEMSLAVNGLSRDLPLLLDVLADEIKDPAFSSQELAKSKPEMRTTVTLPPGRPRTRRCSSSEIA